MTIKNASEVSKFRAPAGTLVRVCWPDVTSWNLSGWTFVRSEGNRAILRKVR